MKGTSKNSSGDGGKLLPPTSFIYTDFRADSKHFLLDQSILNGCHAGIFSRCFGLCCNLKVKSIALEQKPPSAASRWASFWAFGGGLKGRPWLPAFTLPTKCLIPALSQVPPLTRNHVWDVKKAPLAVLIIPTTTVHRTLELIRITKCVCVCVCLYLLHSEHH